MNTMTSTSTSTATSTSGWSRIVPRLRRFGLAGITLFTLKGLIWLAVPVMVKWWMG